MLRIILLGNDLTAAGVEKHLRHFDGWDIELKVFPQPKLPLVEFVWDTPPTRFFIGEMKYFTFTRIAALYGVGIQRLEDDLHQLFDEEKLYPSSHVSSELFHIDVKEKVLFYGDEEHPYDHLVSTLPLNLFLNCLRESEKIFPLTFSWRDRLSRTDDVPPMDTEIYVENRGQFFVAQVDEEDFTCNFLHGALEISLTTEPKESSWTRDLFFYPNWSEEIENLLLQLEDQSIYSRGKYGSWKTIFPDMAFLQGVEVVDTILAGAAETALFEDLVEERFPLDDPTSVLVVHRSNESLSWISAEECGSRTIVYNRGSSFNVPVFNTIDGQKLKGSHVGAFLDYIIKNYHELPNVTVFITGKFGLFRDKQGIPPLSAYEETISFFAGPSTQSSDWGALPRNTSLIEDLEAGFVSPYKGTLLEMWNSIFPGETHPDTFSRLVHTIFSVHASVIQKHPLSFYQRLLSLVSHHKNPEECRYIDALWTLIFS